MNEKYTVIYKDKEKKCSLFEILNSSKVVLFWREYEWILAKCDV